MVNSHGGEGPRPNEDDLERGGYYASRIGSESDFAGEILDQSGAVCWRFGTEPKLSPYSVRNLLRNPDFVVTDSDEQAVLCVRRVTRLPAVFEIIQNEQVAGQIKLRSVFRNKYTFDLKDSGNWTFQMPLFTTRFCGLSDKNSHVWVVVGPSKRQWSVLIEPGVESPQLLASLAFIHRQWWCYS